MKNLFISLLFLNSYILFSQNTSDVETSILYDISGVIIDNSTGETLPYATVFLVGSQIGTTSNGDGYFTLLDVPNKFNLLEISYNGYTSRQFDVSKLNTNEKIKFTLEESVTELNEVILDSKNNKELIHTSNGVSQVGLNTSMIKQLPSIGEKDVFRALQLLPGISGSNESSSGLYVRGGTPDQNLILFDDFTVYHVDHLFGFFSAFNSNAIKDIQIYKGGFESKFGGRLSSVVEITGKDGNTNYTNFGVGLSNLSSNLFFESPFSKGKGSFIISGRRSFQSNFYNNIFESFSEINESSSTTVTPQNVGRGGRNVPILEVQPNTYFYDLNSKITYRFNEKDIVSLSIYNGQDNLDNSRDVNESSFTNPNGGVRNFNFNQESTDLAAWGNTGGSLKWSRRWGNKFYSNANVSYSNYFSERDRMNITNIVRSDTTLVRNNGNIEKNNLTDFTVKVDNELKLSSKNQLDFGFQSSRNEILYSYVQNDSISVIDRYDESQLSSLYIQDKQLLGENLVLKGGLRSSYFSQTEELYIEPRFSFNYVINEGLEFKGAWGKYYQFINRVVREDIQQGSRDFWVMSGSENIPVSSSIHYITGLSYSTSIWNFDIETYYKTLDGLSEYSTRISPSGLGGRGVLSFDEFFFNGSGKAKGVELLIQKKKGRLTGWAGYTLSEVKYDFPDFSLDPFPANQDVTNEFKLFSNYSFGKLSLSSTFIYATGRPYTAPIGFYEVDLLDGSSSDFYELSSKNAVRFDDYHRLDFSANYEFKIGKSRANLGMSLINIYNRRNTWYKEFDVVEGELFETNISLLGFTPNLSFSWTLK